MGWRVLVPRFLPGPFLAYITGGAEQLGSLFGDREVKQCRAGRQHPGMALSLVPSWPQGRCEADPRSPCPSNTLACTAFSPASKILPRVWLLGGVICCCAKHGSLRASGWKHSMCNGCRACVALVRGLGHGWCSWRCRLVALVESRP